MNQILIFVLGLIIGAGAAWLYAKSKQHSNILENVRMSKPAGAGNLGGFNKQRDEKIDLNEGKILDLFSEKPFGAAQGETRITNNDVEKLLGVSDATAERYLQKLESQGKIRQMKDTGRGVTYVKN